MAAQWCESFQVYPSTADMEQGVWAQIDSGWNLDPTHPASGTQGMGGFSGGSTWPAMRRVFNAALSTVGVAMRFYVTSLPTSEAVVQALMLMTFMDGAAHVCVSLVLGTDGAIVLYGGGLYQNGGGNLTSATFLTRSEPCISAAAFNHIEAKVTPGATGAVEVRVNGVTVVNFTGDTLNHNQVTQWATMAGTTLINMAMYYGDLHAWDTLSGYGPSDFVGNAAVLTRVLDADTAIADWVPTGTHPPVYPLLEDNNDATYISGNSVSARSAFGAADFPGNVYGVVYMQANFRGLKNGAGDCDVAAGFISGGIDVYDAGDAMAVGESWFWAIIGTDPATSAPWTVDGANAADLILKRTL